MYMYGRRIHITALLPLVLKKAIVQGMLIASVTPGAVGIGARGEGDGAVTLKIDLNGEEKPGELLEVVYIYDIDI